MTWIGWIPRQDGQLNLSWFALMVLGDEADLEERIERAWLQRIRSPRPHPRRRRFRDDVLGHYPFTQPPDICQRCLRWIAGGLAWDLDHLVELQYGGIDDPTNLVRLCWVCHREKPLPPEHAWDDPEAMRELAVDWIRRGPANGVRTPLLEAMPWIKAAIEGPE